MSEVLSVEQARERVLALFKTLPAEEVPLLDALNRVLAEDAVSDIDVAPFDNSAMDGFAVRVADLSSADESQPARLTVVAHIAAGDDVGGIEIGAGEVARIMTGAAVPQGADAVVMVERTSVSSGDGGIGSVVEFTATPPLGDHIRLRGEEVRAGDVVIAAGDVLGPAGIGLLASTGHATVRVHRRPRVAILSTGSELVEVAEKPGPGKIRNSNSYSIAAQVIEAGGVPVRYPIIPDEMDATRAAFTQASQECDFVLTSGGVSVGDFDYVKPVLEELGELQFCKVMMRPGNPQTFGHINGVPLFGLPGNPTSTYVGFEIFCRPAIRLMQGFSDLDRPVTRATLAHDVKKRQDRRYFLRGRVERAQQHEPGAPAYVASLSGSQSSALLTAAHLGNCFIVLPEGIAPVAAGTVVDCIRLDQKEGTP